MRRALTAAAIVAICSGAASAEEALPTRKGGLWELVTAMDEGKGPREQTFKICIADDMEANAVRASVTEHKQNCESYEIKKSGEETVVNAKCVFNGRHVDTTTTMSGDFAKAFKVDIESRTSDKKESTDQTVVVQRTIKQTGSFVSDSCGDLKPGEAATADGAKVQVQ